MQLRRAVIVAAARGIHVARGVQVARRGAWSGGGVDVSKRSLEAVSRNDDAAAVFVVTGASRGIGAEFVSQLLARTKGTVVSLR